MKDFSLNWRTILILLTASYLFAFQFTGSFIPKVLAEELRTYEQEKAFEITQEEAYEALGMPQ